MADEFRQLYDLNPDLLEMEKYAMQKFFPQFNLVKIDDGRMCWHDTIKIDENKEYCLMAVYARNHPFCYREFSSVSVYPLLLGSEEILSRAKDTPGFLKDEVGT